MASLLNDGDVDNLNPTKDSEQTTGKVNTLANNTKNKDFAHFHNRNKQTK